MKRSDCQEDSKIFQQLESVVWTINNDEEISVNVTEQRRYFVQLICSFTEVVNLQIMSKETFSSSLKWSGKDLWLGCMTLI